MTSKERSMKERAYTLTQIQELESTKKALAIKMSQSALDVAYKGSKLDRGLLERFDEIEERLKYNYSKIHAIQEKYGV